MKSKDWWRNLPHLKYGNYGGRENSGNGHTLYPIDEMDGHFKIHDLTLLHNLTSEDRANADCHLLQSLLYQNNDNISKPIYGRLYKWGCIFIFSIILIINMQKGLVK